MNPNQEDANRSAQESFGSSGFVPPASNLSAPPGAGAAPLNLAPWGKRALALIIDSLIMVVPATILFLLFAGGLATTPEDDGGGFAVAGIIVGVLIMLAVMLLYAPLLMRRSGEHNGKTLGKQAMNIRVVRDNGLPFDFGSAAVREVALKGLLLGVIGNIPLLGQLAILVNYLWPLYDDEKRAGHDLLAKTHVVLAD